MKPISLIVLYFLLYLKIGICADADGNQWNSPDGKLTLLVKYNDRENYYIIRNNITKKSSRHISAYTLPVYIKWTGVSNSIIVIEHISGSSILRELTVQNNNWIARDIGHPEDWESFRVVAINTQKNIATFKCAVVRKKRSFMGVATFDCDLDTGDTANFKYQNVSWAEFKTLEDLHMGK